MRRLNRTEYNNTIRDLVGVDFKPADDFPSDDVGYGFDNIGDVLTISPLLMERYLAAAADDHEAGDHGGRTAPSRRKHPSPGIPQSESKAKSIRDSRCTAPMTQAKVRLRLQAHPRTAKYVFRVRGWRNGRQ